MRAVFAVFLLLACANATKWYAVHDLPETEVETLTKAGCYRGNYGGVQDNLDERTLSLITCEREGATFLGEMPDDTFLCVVELSATTTLTHAIAGLLKHNSTRVLFAGRQEIVLYDEATPTEKPEMCCRRALEAGVIDNAIYVARQPVVAQRPAPVAHPALKRLNEVEDGKLANPNPDIVNYLKQYDRDMVLSATRGFSTDNEGLNTRITRNSYAITTGRGGCANTAWKCSNHVVDQLVADLNGMFKEYVGQWEVTAESFRTDMCPNVILRMVGANEPEQIVVSGAHLDSRNTNSGSGANGPAPGADDNGSGSAVLLEMARVIADQNIRFHYSVHFLWFCGEEQGLLGSDVLARAYASRGDTIIGMFNNDMIGYTSPSHGVTLSFMTGSATAWLTEACIAYSNIYIPDLATGRTSACCSDQQSFFRAGFPAAGIFETPTTSVVYPQYHREGDTWDNGLVNHDQVWQFGMANFACMMEFALPLEPM